MQKVKTGESQQQVKKISTKYIVLTALFVAMTFVVTYFVNIPAAFILGAGGNINLGDCIIFIAAVVLGPVGGAIAGAVGATIADISSAWFIYAPFTFVIKGLAGFMCGFLYRNAFSKLKLFPRTICSILIAAAIIVAGYFFAEIAIVAISGGDTFGAYIIMGLRTIVPNLVQVTVSSIIALIVMPKLVRDILYL